MDDPIMTIGMFEQRVKERAQRDHAAGVPLSDCEYNPGTRAAKTREAEYARLDALAHASPSLQTTPARRRRFDQAQSGRP